MVYCALHLVFWRDGRAAEGAPLLREYEVKSFIEGSNPSLSAIFQIDYYAPVAQLDRVLGYEPRGREFESLRARHIFSVGDIMIGIKKIVFVCTLIFMCISSAATVENLPPSIKLPSLAPMLDRTMKATVNVSIQGAIPEQLEVKNKKTFPSKPRKFEALGSGVIIDPIKGYIITNAHVIQYAKTVIVTLNDGSRVNAKIIGSDSDTDIAVIQIKANKLPSIEVGNSDKLRVGDFVVAVGNPFGLNSFGNSQTATLGIVSALQRSDINIEGIENFIQTDAAINPGNSGGALLNMQGQLVGISTAILSPSRGNVGIGFAIPINMAIDVMQQIIKYGSIHRGLVGVYVQPLTPELSSAFGLPPETKGGLIAQVNEESPAEKAGLKSGDIVISINGMKINDASQVKNIISLLRVGSKAKMQIIRDNKTLTLNAVVTDAKKHEQKLQSKNPFLYGLALRDFAQESPLHGRVVGVQVVGVSESSAGWRAGIRPGDVIVYANRKTIESLDSLEKVASETKTQLLVQVLRGSGSLYIIIK
jgi:serine protease Do